MPLLPRLGRVADLRFSPPEALPHTALRASDYHFPYGGVGIVDLQKLKPTVPVFGHRSPAKDRVTRLIVMRCPPAVQCSPAMRIGAFRRAACFPRRRRLFIAERNRSNLLRCRLLGRVVELTVLDKHCDAGHKRIRPADLAKPC